MVEDGGIFETQANIALIRQLPLQLLRLLGMRVAALHPAREIALFRVGVLALLLIICILFRLLIYRIL